MEFITKNIQLPIPLAKRLDFLATLCDLTTEQFISALMIIQLNKEGWIPQEETSDGTQSDT